MNKHGNINFSWEEDLFIMELEGPFNEEGISCCFEEIKKSVEDKATKTWKRLEIWDDEVIGSLKSIEIGRIIQYWFEEKGCIKAAAVVSNTLQEDIIINIFKNRIKIFRDKEKALKWLYHCA